MVITNIDLTVLAIAVTTCINTVAGQTEGIRVQKAEQAISDSNKINS